MGVEKLSERRVEARRERVKRAAEIEAERVGAERVAGDGERVMSKLEGIGEAGAETAALRVESSDCLRFELENLLQAANESFFTRNTSFRKTIEHKLILKRERDEVKSEIGDYVFFSKSNFRNSISGLKL